MSRCWVFIMLRICKRPLFGSRGEQVGHWWLNISILHLWLSDVPFENLRPSGKISYIHWQLFNQLKCSSFFNCFSNYCLSESERTVEIFLCVLWKQICVWRQMSFTVVFLVCRALQVKSGGFCQQYEDNNKDSLALNCHTVTIQASRDAFWADNMDW